MMIELIRMAIGINAKTKNNCRANLFMVIGEHIYPRYVKHAYVLSNQMGEVHALS